MPQTFYVAQDEEILSIVSRLRSSALLENVFVIPKRALILQSIVNLRLLARDAEKLGKTVTIVTQDEQGRMLAEKAGLVTKTYSDDMKAREEEARFVGVPKTNEDKQLRQSVPLPETASLGSSDFFSDGAAVKSYESIVERGETEAHRTIEQSMSPPSEMKIRVRDNTPKRLPHLNSLAEQSAPISTAGVPNYHQPSVSSAVLPSSTFPTDSSSSSHEEKENRIGKLFGRRPAEDPRIVASVQPTPSKHTSKKEAEIGSGGRGWLIFFALVSIFSIIGIAAFLLFPKAEITIVPLSSAHNLALSFSGNATGELQDSDLPARVIEYEEWVVVSADATGSSMGGSNKAHGTIVIYNEYGTSSQPLVATTRFASEDGKVFRLAKSVTVPGITEIGGKKEAGAIEAEVVADQAGEAYNVSSDTIFAIPGFKGNPKYEKFSAKAKGSFSGGGSDSTGSGMSVIAESDIAAASKKALDQFREQFDANITSLVEEHEAYVLDSAEMQQVGSATHPEVGMAASSFEYRTRFTGRIFVFSEEALKNRAVEKFKEKAADPKLSSNLDHMTVVYTEIVPDYEKNRVSIRASVSSKMTASIDVSQLKSDLLGKHGDEFKSFIDTHREIKKMEVVFRPRFFTSAVPNDPDRVSVTVVNEESL